MIEKTTFTGFMDMNTLAHEVGEVPKVEVYRSIEDIQATRCATDCGVVEVEVTVKRVVSAPRERRPLIEVVKELQ